MRGILPILLCLISSPWGSLSCYEECTQKFLTDMTAFGVNETANVSSPDTTSFCRLMSLQIACINAAVANCTPVKRDLVQTMLASFIVPDFQRTCGVSNLGVSYSAANATTGEFTNNTGIVPTSGRLLMVCREKMMHCQTNFNHSVRSYDASRNISAMCQSLKEFTLCYVDILSSECGHLVNRNMVKTMQDQHGSVCSADAQANTNTLMDCANKTLKCYSVFNSSFTPAVKDYKLMVMCSSIDNYTKCMLEVSTTTQCAQFTSQTLASIMQLKKRHNVYCGDDNGQTALRCAETFQGCYSQFNKTFFPALHSGDVSLMCSSLDTYSLCVNGLSSQCVQQLDQMVRSVQLLKLQFRDKCHPKILKLATCSEVVSCTSAFLSNFTSFPANQKICGSLGDYFRCVAKGLNACSLPQSTTDVSFGALGKLMQDYCENVPSNSKLRQCHTFVKCTTAVSTIFSPSIKSLYEGSTWCTFLQFHFGCAEHALQSSGCYLDDDDSLKKHIASLDSTRMATCAKDPHQSHVEKHQSSHDHAPVLYQTKWFPLSIALLMILAAF